LKSLSGFIEEWLFLSLSPSSSATIYFLAYSLRHYLVSTPMSAVSATRRKQRATTAATDPSGAPICQPDPQDRHRCEGCNFRPNMDLARVADRNEVNDRVWLCFAVVYSSNRPCLAEHEVAFQARTRTLVRHHTEATTPAVRILSAAGNGLSRAFL